MWGILGLSATLQISLARIKICLILEVELTRTEKSTERVLYFCSKIVGVGLAGKVTWILYARSLCFNGGSHVTHEHIDESTQYWRHH